MAERVWDRFLTEQDKATLVGKADRRIGFGDRPALLLIDLIAGFSATNLRWLPKRSRLGRGAAGLLVGTPLRTSKSCSPKRVK